MRTKYRLERSAAASEIRPGLRRRPGVHRRAVRAAADREGLRPVAKAVPVGPPAPPQRVRIPRALAFPLPALQNGRANRLIAGMIVLSQPRALIVAGAAAAAWGLVACGGPVAASHPARRPEAGVVRGFAAPCAGPPSAATGPITIEASRGGRVVASETRRYPNLSYRLELTPGRYRISAPGSSDPSRVVVVRSGRTTTVNFPDSCV